MGYETLLFRGTSIPTFVSQSTKKWIYNPKCPSSKLLMDILLQCPVKKITTPD